MKVKGSWDDVSSAVDAESWEELSGLTLAGPYLRSTVDVVYDSDVLRFSLTCMGPRHRLT